MFRVEPIEGQVPYLGDLADELAEMNLKKDGVEVEIIVCCEKVD